MKKLWAWKRELGHGARVPRGWRMAWYEPRRRVGVYFPAPLHVVARAWRDFRYRLRVAREAYALEHADFVAMQREHAERERMADEYARGYLNGWRECYRDCIAVLESEFTRGAAGDDVWALGAALVDACGDGDVNAATSAGISTLARRRREN